MKFHSGGDTSNKKPDFGSALFYNQKQIMANRFKIVLSHEPQPDNQGVPQGLSPLGRLKVIVGGILIAVVAVVVLVLAFLLGSFIAASVWILFVIASVALVLKSSFRRARR